MTLIRYAHSQKIGRKVAMSSNIYGRKVAVSSKRNRGQVAVSSNRDCEKFM
jgi:hypothetical protein